MVDFEIRNDKSKRLEVYLEKKADGCIVLYGVVFDTRGLFALLSIDKEGHIRLFRGISKNIGLIVDELGCLVVKEQS
jgi:hypothetical protein